jgi:hypothetical protein
LPAAVAGAREARSPSHPDDELLRLGAEFDRLYAAIAPLTAKSQRLDEIFNLVYPGGIPSGSFDKWAKFRVDCGLGAAIHAENTAEDLAIAVVRQINKTPARTFAGLAVKARALRFDTGFDNKSNVPEDDLDWPQVAVNNFLDEIERLGVETQSTIA